MSGAGGPITCDRGAPGFGLNFCVRPPYVSATYRFSCESTEIWWIPQNAPGNVP